MVNHWLNIQVGRDVSPAKIKERILREKRERASKVAVDPAPLLSPWVSADETEAPTTPTAALKAAPAAEAQSRCVIA